ncbi:DUF2249 domain-containing protein [Evansella sp. AB-rgal1]|uniref:DUF2249 domain-containing protein n=1 Tax=Evansella sp. AB-rgal1 TaxID=3242696 RepID=UPI00359D4BFF
MDNIIELDVREDIATGNDPFQKIMSHVEELDNHKQLLLHTPFVPRPLFQVMSAKGFSYDTVKMSEEHFVTTFTKIVQ